MSDEPENETAEASTGTTAPSPVYTFKQFLEEAPPGREYDVTGIAKDDAKRLISPAMTGRPTPQVAPREPPTLETPIIRRFCMNDDCNGERNYSCVSTTLSKFPSNGLLISFLQYQCDNCKRSRTTIAIEANIGALQGNGALRGGILNGKAFKFGEAPPFGPHVPPRLISLVGPDRDIFLQGRRCEAQGLGIGAFAYYRRVVENQKSRILGEIVKAAQTLGAAAPLIETLKRAQREQQFSNALQIAKDAIPERLFIKGHSPLGLLHTALSDSLHAKDDAHCLQLAHDIRVVLAELAVRISEVLRDQKELNEAVSRLMKSRDT